MTEREREAAALRYLEAHEAELSRLWAKWLADARKGRGLTVFQVNCIYAGSGMRDRGAA